MGQGGGGRFQETFDQKMNVKHMNVFSLSVIFSFLEAALKRRPRAIQAEIKQLMSAQLKTHLQCAWWWSKDGRENDCLGNACFTLSSQ